MDWMRFRLLPLLLLALLAAGCGGTATLDSDSAPGLLPGFTVGDEPLPDLAPDADSREASAATLSLPGSAYYNSHHTTTIYGGKAWLVSTASQRAFARYRLRAVPAGELPETLSLAVDGTMQYQYGIIDWTLGAWVWSSLVSGDQALELPAQGSYVAADGSFYVDIRPLVRKKIVVEGLSLSTARPDLPPVDPPLMSVARWQGNALAAVSLSFDDATPDHWNAGLPLWDEYGYKVTLGILTSRFTDDPARLPQLAQAAAAGHELANHTQTHPDLTVLSPAQVAAEFDAATALIEQHVPGYKVRTAIYPYGSWSAPVGSAALSRFIAARGGDRGIGDTTPVNPWQSLELGNLMSYAPLNMLPMWQWNGAVNDALFHGGWLIEQCHGIGLDGAPGVGWSARPVSEYRAHYDYLQNLGDSVWVAPIGTVAKYAASRSAAVFRETSATAQWIEFKLSDGLDDAVYDEPLTVIMDAMPGWTGATATQGGQSVPLSSAGGKWKLRVRANNTAVLVSRSGS